MVTPIEFVEIDAQLVTGPIPTQAQMNDGMRWPNSPRGAKPIGDNSFVMVNTTDTEVVDVGATVQRTVLPVDGEGDPGLSYFNYGFARLDHDRVIALLDTTPVVSGTIISTAGGTPHTATGSGRWFRLVGPVDNPDAPDQSQDRWLPSNDQVWLDSSGQAHAVFRLDRDRFDNGKDYENYLISFPVNDTEVADMAATKLLLPPASTQVPNPDAWLSGAAFPLTDNAFVVLDETRINDPTPQGARRNTGQLRAFTYSGTQIAVTPELFTQTFDNHTGIGITGATNIQRSADGTIVVLVAEREDYSSAVASRFRMRRCTFTGSSWSLGSETVVFDSGPINGSDSSSVINFQEFQPGRFVIDSLRFDGGANRHVNRVLTFLDADFAVEQEVVVPVPDTVKYPTFPDRPASWLFDTQNWWSSFGEGSFALMGWETYGGADERYNNIPHVATVQHSPFIIPAPPAPTSIDPNLTADLLDAGQRYE